MTEEYAASRYEEACALLPSRLRTASLALPLRQKAEIDELRLRIGRQAFLTLPDGEVPLQHTMVCLLYTIRRCRRSYPCRSRCSPYH